MSKRYPRVKKLINTRPKGKGSEIIGDTEFLKLIEDELARYETLRKIANIVDNRWLEKAYPNEEVTIQELLNKMSRVIAILEIFVQENTSRSLGEIKVDI